MTKLVFTKRQIIKKIKSNYKKRNFREKRYFGYQEAVKIFITSWCKGSLHFTRFINVDLIRLFCRTISRQSRKVKPISWTSLNPKQKITHCKLLPSHPQQLLLLQTRFIAIVLFMKCWTHSYLYGYLYILGYIDSLRSIL